MPEFRIGVGIADGRRDKRLPVIGSQRVLMAGTHVGVPIVQRSVHGGEVGIFEEIGRPIVPTGHVLAGGGIVLRV